VDTLNAAGAQLNLILELRTLQITDWNNTKVILARLADGDRFQNLDTYYRRVRDLSTSVLRLYNQSTFHAGPMGQAQELAEQSKTASDAARRESQEILDS
jgi:hypothetical protein